MLLGQNISVHFGSRTLLDNVNFKITQRARVGLIGRNGTGKSTLFQIITNQRKPDTGTIDFPLGWKTGLLHQDIDLPAGKTVLEETMMAYGDLQAEMDALDKLREEVLNDHVDHEDPQYLKKYELYLHMEEHMAEGHLAQFEADTERVLKGLGFKQSDFDRPIETFSGGWRMRVELAKLLLKNPEILLLDEPTNHLDIESIIWLENFLKSYPGAAVIISHDEEFLNAATTSTWELSLSKIREFPFPYKKALEFKEEDAKRTLAAYNNQQRDLAHKQRLVDKFRAKASKATFAKSLQKQIDREEKIEIEDDYSNALAIRFQEVPRSGEVVIDVRNLKKSYGDLYVLRGVDLKVLRSEKVAFVGKNGQGKSTLVKLITGEIQPDGGEIVQGHQVFPAYYAQEQSQVLDKKMTILETMTDGCPENIRTKIRSILGAFLFQGEDVDKKVVVLSGGERARLALACMMRNPINLLILDEPTNHLDISSKQLLKEAIENYTGALVVVSHDREFLTGMTTKTYEFTEGTIKEYLGDVHYFLQKKGLETLQEVQLEKKNNAAIQNTKNSKSKPDKQVQNIEKKIQKIESEIQQLELKLADPDYYKHKDFNTTIQQIEKLKKELSKCMQEWEQQLGE